MTAAMRRRTPRVCWNFSSVDQAPKSWSKSLDTLEAWIDAMPPKPEFYRGLSDLRIAVGMHRIGLASFDQSRSGKGGIAARSAAANIWEAAQEQAIAGTMSLLSNGLECDG